MGPYPPMGCAPAAPVRHPCAKGFIVQLPGTSYSSLPCRRHRRLRGPPRIGCRHSPGTSAERTPLGSQSLSPAALLVATSAWRCACDVDTRFVLSDGRLVALLDLRAARLGETFSMDLEYGRCGNEPPAQKSNQTQRARENIFSYVDAPLTRQWRRHLHPLWAQR